jgi:iron complex outermembrane receptor protein
MMSASFDQAYLKPFPGSLGGRSMKVIRTALLWLVVMGVGSSPVAAGQGAAAPPAPAAEPAQAGQGGPSGSTSTAEPAQEPTYSETVVVSASKTEQQLVDAPATMTVIGPRALEVAPSGNYSELLRGVPGLNITQISARDVNVTSRGATGSLATSQLAVLDGRSLYQDFFGFVMWDFMPADLEEIKRIEVIRGPASAVWGANALNGVISVIRKTPREAPGTTITIGGGLLNREVNGDGAKAGGLYYIRGSHARAINDRVAFRISTGTYVSDALARPTGIIPNATNTPYPAYANTGTSQPKVDVRVDYDFPDGQRKLQIAGGFAATDGIMHTGIGPFDIDGGARLGYWKLDFTRQAFKLQAFMNTLDGSATNRVSVDPAGRPIGLDFSTRTFDVEAGNTTVVGAKNVLTYGGNLRINRFDLTLAPSEKSRTEGGLYVQDEILVSDRLRAIAGARIDKFTSIAKAVFSPRLALVVKPEEAHSIRVSYNRAFRAPSMVNNNLDTTIGTPLPLGLLSPLFGSAVYMVPTRAVGNRDLTEEYIDAFEVAYTGNVGDRATISVATYYTQFKNSIYFTTTGAWTTPPDGFPGVPFPLPPAVLWQGVLNAGIRFPSGYSYLNLGEVKSKGLELGLDTRLSGSVSAFANYAFQADPIPSFPGLSAAEALAEINRPSKHMVNFGISCLTRTGFGNVSVSHAGRAFWQDVLDSRYHGFTKAFTSVNATLGTKLADGRYSLALKVTNLGNRQVQQHIFGDVVKRQVVAELKMHLR